ncbi:MAG: hypothetical protein JOS17DRAFT_819363 [Linnemannia elongata]|nr:MAG: hypothetical protein JOS17DRAFT_819363 [Linnemannia elongata]
MKKTLSILRDISPYLHSPFRHQLTMLAALSRFIRIPELLTALVDFLGPHELARLMQTCHYVKSFCEPAPYRHLDLTFHPRRTNLLLAPKAKDFLEWQQTIGTLSKLRTLQVSILTWSSKVLKRWLREWSNLLAVCPPSIREFEVHRVYFLFPGHEDDFDYYQLSWDEGHDELTTTTNLWQILEGCPNVDSLQLSGFRSEMGGFDLASVIITGCPSLKRLMYDATSNPGDSNVPFRVMSIMQNSDQIEELVLDALSLKESFLPIARMGLQNHAESLRVTRLGNCPTTNRVATLPFFLPNVLASKNSTFFPPRSILDLVLISRTLSPLVPGRVPRSAASCLADQLGLLARHYQQIGALKDLRVLDLRACVATHPLPRVSSRKWNLGRDCFPALLNLENTDTGRPGYLSLLGGLTHLEELRGSVCLTTPEYKVTVGLSEARWMNENWSNLRVAWFFLKGDKPNKPFVWLAKKPRKAKLELSATGLSHS